MTVHLTPVDPVGDRDDLIAFLSGHRFPFHLTTELSARAAGDRIDAGNFSSPDNLAYWISAGEHNRCGYIAFAELLDGAPMIDLRIAGGLRSRGIGSAALAAATSRLFQAQVDVTRIEGNTRQDNIAMRRTFIACGYVKEAHYRDGWPVGSGTYLDSVGYAILRRDWHSGTVTPVQWEH